MRPQVLYPIFSDIISIPGIGSKTKEVFQHLAGERILDILYHLPVGFIDRRNMPDILSMQNGDVVTAIVSVQAYSLPPMIKDRKLPFKVICYNKTGFINLIFFQAFPEYIKKSLPIGEERVISGRVERFGGEIQIAHPDYIVPVAQLDSVRRLEPVYPLAAGVYHKKVINTVNEAIKRTPDNMPEWIEPEFVKKNGWQGWKESLIAAHLIVNPEDISPNSKSRQRLAYDELLASQLALALVRKYVNRNLGRSFKGNGNLSKKLLEKLPFTLTGGQQEVIKEINSDQESPNRMTRLLQGDVGSGKTIVALFSALNAVEAGAQVAIMAPTEILAVQHYKWIEKITSEIGVKVALLIGKTKGKERENIINNLKNGEINIVVGTHALFQENVEFKDLGLVIIDEQHRFGVEQRVSLANKGNNVDVLLMTATPIPRTLTMAAYGDMECSRLTEKPTGRKEIDTRIMHFDKIAQIITGLKRVLEKGDKIYWICPLIESSEKSDLAAAQERANVLKKFFGDKVGLLHGRMKASEREEVMSEFKSGNIDMLVATTVVEVGVDVPDATVIVIEHAERFGLSQLHQLRGRVGRNDKQSSCILLYHGLGEVAKERLKIMRESNDGFRLAEEDLRIRGGGDVLGTKQSGLPQFKVANLYEHYQLLKIAHDDARKIMEIDPFLQTERGKALKILLYLFGYDKQVALC